VKGRRLRRIREFHAGERNQGSIEKKIQGRREVG